MAATDIVLSGPAGADLVIYRGDSGHFRVTFTDILGAPVDVVGMTFLCQIRRSTDTQILTSLIVTPTPGIPEAIDITLSAADSALLTEDGIYDLQAVAAGEVTTVLRGAVRITRDISK